MTRNRRPDYVKVMGGQRCGNNAGASTRQSSKGLTHEVNYPTHAGCPLHQSIADAAEEALTSKGYFNKADLLADECTFHGVATDLSMVDVHWDYVLRYLQSGRSTADLPDQFRYICLTSEFFSQHQQNLRKKAWTSLDYASVMTISGRMVGSPKSGKVKGYALIEYRNADLVLARLQRTNRLAKNLAANVTSEAIEAQRNGVSPAAVSGVLGSPAALPVSVTTGDSA